MPENDNYWLSWPHSGFHTNYCFVMERDCEGLWGWGQISPARLKTLDYNWQVTVCLLRWWVDYSLPWLPQFSLIFLRSSIIGCNFRDEILDRISERLLPHPQGDRHILYLSYICKGLADNPLYFYLGGIEIEVVHCSQLTVQFTSQIVSHVIEVWWYFLFCSKMS